MSNRYKGGVISATAPTTSTSTAKGIWTITQQMQSIGASVWPRSPGAPTIGTATATGATTATVAFTAPSDLGAGSITYTATSSPDSLTGTGASPITVSGLTTGTSYTFQVSGATPGGTGPASAASNSVTPIATCATYTTAGTFTWVAPTGVTSVAAVVVAGGGQNGAGSLSYKNSITVVPGTGYTVVVGAGAPVQPTGGSASGGTSSFVSNATVSATSASTRVGDGGGLGPSGFGSGAGGYAGNGGTMGNPGANAAASGTAGAGGAGGGGGRADGSSGTYCTIAGGAGGGVGLFGQGSNGTAGTATYSSANNVTGCSGGGGSSGCTGGNTTASSPSSTGGAGGAYGGGSGRMKYQINCVSTAYNYGAGGGGAVRIVWCVGGARGTPSFPSTNVGA